MNKFWECNVWYGDDGYLKAGKKVDFKLYLPQKS